MNPEDVEKMKNIAYIQSQIACFYADMVKMQMYNAEDERMNRVPTYDADSFETLPNHYGLSHNQVLIALNGC